MSLDAVTRLLERNRDHADEFDELLAGHGDGQAPDAVTVCCSDSRVLQDRMWGNDEPGDVFTVSNIGNRVRQHTPDGPVVSGDVLYPLVHTGTEAAIVVGHTGCGAVTATYQLLDGQLGDEPAGIEACVELLAADLEDAFESLPAELDDAAAVNRLVQANVDRQVAHLQESADVSDSVTVVGVVYDLHGIYDGPRGRTVVINVAGETDPATIRETHPELADWAERL